jgi:hypothetical protein
MAKKKAAVKLTKAKTPTREANEATQRREEQRKDTIRKYGGTGQLMDSTETRSKEDFSQAAASKRTPKVGDRVMPHGHHGAFVVSQLYAENQTAKVTKIGTQTPVLIVEWKDLSFLDELDESQNALRVVREATED